MLSSCVSSHLNGSPVGPDSLYFCFPQQKFAKNPRYDYDVITCDYDVITCHRWRRLVYPVSLSHSRTEFVTCRASCKQMCNAVRCTASSQTTKHDNDSIIWSAKSMCRVSPHAAPSHSSLPALSWCTAGGWDVSGLRLRCEKSEELRDTVKGTFCILPVGFLNWICTTMK